MAALGIKKAGVFILRRRPVSDGGGGEGAGAGEDDEAAAAFLSSMIEVTPCDIPSDKFSAPMIERCLDKHHIVAPPPPHGGDDPKQEL